MSLRIHVFTAALVLAPCIVAAQTHPVADAFRETLKYNAKNLVEAAEEMPADKYAFKPTPAQMSFAAIQTHLAEGNDVLCGKIGGMNPPTRTKVAESAGKDALVARLKESFAFCEQAAAKLDDAKLTEKMTVFGMNTTRAGVILITSLAGLETGKLGSR